ncbi:VOC family protein [Solimonas sp. SE-A11]|uniref:VOC family protein n=1 Tax=Solimonas sp. SE-A11 TaxID=3054954 RepID=UPI00259C6F56|nr:VOC family protein [Solimonas sp. SE-A11]MDM4771322.1 VOC family protein [Solimonas sp. SE-A11]
MKAHTLLYPVDRLDPAIDFFRDTLGLPLKFRDGERYAALDAGGLTLGLAAGEERIVDRPALALRVDDLDAALARLLEQGATLLRPVENGPHERRTVLQAPGGHPLIVSAKR